MRGGRGKKVQFRNLADPSASPSTLPSLVRAPISAPTEAPPPPEESGAQGAYNRDIERQSASHSRQALALTAAGELHERPIGH
jgi:hypothetical protein